MWSSFGQYELQQTIMGFCEKVGSIFSEPNDFDWIC